MLNNLRWKITTVLGNWNCRKAGMKLGANVRMMGLPILHGRLKNITIGDRVTLCSDPRGTALGVRAPVILRTMTETATITIGEDCGLSGTAICSAVSVIIGKRVLLGADVMIFDNDFHAHAPENRRYAKPDFAKISRPVIIEDDVFIGTRCTIAKGAHIGRGSIIAAGSIVTGPIPPMSVAAGAPANVVRKLDDPSRAPRDRETGQ